MQFLTYRRWFYSIVFSFSFAACQRPLLPTAALPPDTDIKLDAAIPADSTSEALILPYRQQMAQQMNAVLGVSAQELLRVGAGESALGNFVAEVQMVEALPLYKKPIDMSLMTTGGLRANIPQGPVTLSHIFELLPFENQLVVVTLPGTAVQKMFDQAARNQELIIQNATFTIKEAKPVNILINRQPLAPQKKYKIVMSDYLANGGDDLSFMKEATAVEPVGLMAREALIKHIRELTAQEKPIKAHVDGRMKVQ